MLTGSRTTGFSAAHNAAMAVDKFFQQLDVLIVHIHRPWAYAIDEDWIFLYSTRPRVSSFAAFGSSSAFHALPSFLRCGFLRLLTEDVDVVRISQADTQFLDQRPIPNFIQTIPLRKCAALHANTGKPLSGRRCDRRNGPKAVVVRYSIRINELKMTEKDTQPPANPSKPPNSTSNGNGHLSASAELAAELRKLIHGLDLDGIGDSNTAVEVRQAIGLARHLQRRANALQTPEEKRQQAELDRMIQNPNDKVTLTQMTDQAFRASTPTRAVDQLVHILDVQGIPRFFTPFDRMLLKGFQSFGSYLPGVAVPAVKDKMHEETANVVLPAERDLLVSHLRDRRSEGVRMNVNYLGEALLGEDDAQNRLRNYLQSLQLPEIEVISVKISTIYSQISSIAREASLAIICDRLELLYRAAAKATFTRSDGSVVPKFVYLDMEEYRDMSLTADAFMRTLDRPGLKEVQAGIVLQAYIPDSFQTQRRLLEWARKRVSEGGAPITMRIVKGANMEMERFEASLFGWPQAPYKQKVETDSNYRRMVQLGLEPENQSAVRLGIASHNLFELAYGLVKAVEADAIGHVQFEMLEGMANHQRRALFELSKNLLLYAPACRKEEFINAIGYLVRRLDENTGPNNFLRHAFRLEVGNDDWQNLEEQFREAFDLLPDLSDLPRRTQDRNVPTTPPAARQAIGVSPATTTPPSWHSFTNEPDTDFSLLQNYAWAKKIIGDWKDRHSDRAVQIPLVIGGKEITTERKIRECTDPSRPNLVVGRYCMATADDINAAVECAKGDPSGWRARSATERRAILRDVAQEIRVNRGNLMGAAMADGGKILSESDPEISEAVDFAEFYGETAEYFEQLPGVNASGRGVVVVVSPWNFPVAIPCGGIAAALAAGNTVILKPASDSVLVAYELCKCFWNGGVSRQALQFTPCSGATEGQQLVAHADVDTVILTGGTETALAMLDHRPDTRLLAETGGKNATIVTAMADRDQAIKHVLHSAFGHAGQKCSATSLLILETEVFNDQKFKQNLCDAVTSLAVGSAWELKTKIGPMIRPPSGELETALKELEPGESWAVMPRRSPKNPHLYTPAVKWGVQPGSFTHKTEFFGPVLGVMRSDNLEHAIDLVNATGFGLTSGLESLDIREQQLWKEQIRAGNLYVNRGTTGAIVLRQPFGGMGKSAFGPGIKAGGPNYVAQLMHFEQVAEEVKSDDNHKALTETDHELANQLHLADLAARLEKVDSGIVRENDRKRLIEAIESYRKYFATEFSREHDHFRLIGQDNVRRYLPVRELRIRVDPADSPFETIARVSAAKAAGCRITVSIHSECWNPQPIGWLDAATDSWAASIEFVEESDEQLAEVIRNGHTLRVRYSCPERVPTDIRSAAAKTGLYIADAPVIGHGRIELLWYFEEQSISDNYHRYGNLGIRADEIRSEPA